MSYKLLLIGLLSQLSSFGQTFSLKGEIADPKLDSVSIEYIDKTGKYIHCMVAAPGGRFLLTGVIDQPSFSFLLFKHKGEQLSKRDIELRRYLVYLTPGDMTIRAEGDANGLIHVSGSPTQEEWNGLKIKADATTSPNAVYYEFFINHPGSYVTADRVMYFTNVFSLDSLKHLYTRFTPAIKESMGGRRLAAAIKSREVGLPGTTAFPFVVKDKEGRELSLAQFRGSYVVLDFWATWCAPCRKAMPHMISLYQKYKDKKVAVIAIGDDDRNVAGWLAAIEKDGTGMFHHTLRGIDMELTRKGMPNPRDLDEQYGVRALPTQFLIDPNGTIIGRYDGGNADEVLDNQLAGLLAAGGSSSSSAVVFMGTTDTAYNGKEIVLYNKSTGDHDSTIVKNGQFMMTLKFKEPTRYMFYSKYERAQKGGYAPFGVVVTGPGVVHLTADMANFSNTTVRDAPENDLFLEYIKAGQPGSEQGAEIERLGNFVRQYPNSFAAIYLLSNMSTILPEDKARSYYALLGSSYKGTSYDQNLIRIMAAKSATAIGKLAPDFEQPDTLGKKIRLSEFRGQVVLLDFWASWCGPCRAENPNVVKAYKKFHEKGFTVVGISLDQPGKKEAWLKAIHDDGLSWPQLSDLQFWNNAVARLYGIQAIPQNYLLDREGKIVAVNCKGDELNSVLEKMFKERN